jgi:type IV secretion system protein VirD4
VTVKPSDVARPRDDSLTGGLRRAGTWLTLGLGAIFTVLLGVQIAAFLQGAPHPPFGLRPAAGELVDAFGPGAETTALIAMTVGVIVAGLIAVAAGTALWSQLLDRTGLRASDQRARDQLDGARWAQRSDLQPVLVDPAGARNRVVLGTPRGLGRPRPGELVAVEPGHSALVVAPTGQGKTESVMAPAILDWDGPVVAVSIKRDLYDLTAGWRSELGEVRVLDPAGLTDPTEVRNAYWTPLSEARSWRAARMLADQMSGVGQKGAQQQGSEKFFAETSAELLAGLFFAAAHCPVPTMQTVAGWLTDPKRAIEVLEDLLLELEQDERQPEDVRRNASYALGAIRLRMIGEDPRTVESIRATASATIRAWADYRLGEVAVGDPGVLDPEWLWSPAKAWELPGDQRTLYLIGPDAEQGTYEAMFIGAVTQIYNAYARAVQSGRAPAKRLLLVLDEVANTAPVPKLDTWVTSARGLGIQLVIATQNLAQLDTVWGTEKAETIVSGPRVRMFGPGLADEQTLQYIERISGQTGLVLENESRLPFLLQVPTSRQTQTQWRPLVPQNEASGLPPFTGLTFYGSLRPFLVDWRSAHTDSDLDAKQRLDAVPPGEEERRYLATPAEYRQPVLPDDLRDDATAPAPAATALADQDEDDDAMPEDWAPDRWLADDLPDLDVDTDAD